ncbi:alanyl-tRNA synthetase [Bacillus sp. FJAT-21945]|nr:alanyl-tRNA synthetase [Bacillus sp. FJAT-21945]
MKLEDIKKFLSDNKEQDDVKVYLGELSKPTVEGVKGFLDTEEGKKLIQPKLDTHFTKGLETWKTNNLQKLVDDEVAKRNPAETPEQKELKKLREEIENERKARNRETLVNKALKVAKDKSLPDGIIDFFIADDEETTLANLSKLEEDYSKAVQLAVETKFKESGRNIDQGSGGTQTGAIDINTLAAEASIRN